LSQSTRLTDGQTDRRTDGHLSRETALHSVQRGKNRNTMRACVLRAFRTIDVRF